MPDIRSELAEWQVAVLPWSVTHHIWHRNLTEFYFPSQFGLQDPTLIKTQGFIDGKWVDAKQGGRIVVTSALRSLDHTSVTLTRIPDPATTVELASVPEMGLSETREAINAASKAFQTWGRTTARVRALGISNSIPFTTHWFSTAMIFFSRCML